jgi:hypothetical protein
MGGLQLRGKTSGGTERGMCVPTDLDLQRALSRVAGIVENALESLLPPVDGAESRLWTPCAMPPLAGASGFGRFW